MVSVIVPIYNMERWLHKCVTSILEQSYQKIELILVDDGSNDYSPQICDKYQEIDKRVHVIHKNNEGHAKARESGVKIASGKYIMFIDADDYIMGKDLIKLCIKKLNEYQAEVVCFDYLFKGKLGFYLKNEEIMNRETALKNMLLQNKLDGNLCYKFFSSKVVKSKNIFFSNRRNCDFITTVQMIENAKKILILPVCGYFYRYLGDSSSHSNFCHPCEEEYEQEAFKFYKGMSESSQDIKEAAELNWHKALLYVCIKMEKYRHLSRKSLRFQKVKRNIRNIRKKFLMSSYITIYDKLQYLLCYLNLYRGIYHLYSMIKQMIEKCNGRWKSEK